MCYKDNVAKNFAIKVECENEENTHFIIIISMEVGMYNWLSHIRKHSRFYVTAFVSFVCYVTSIYLDRIEKRYTIKILRNYVSNYQIALSSIEKWFTKFSFMDFLDSSCIRSIISGVFSHMYNILSCVFVNILCLRIRQFYHSKDIKIGKLCIFE